MMFQKHTFVHNFTFQVTKGSQYSCYPYIGLCEMYILYVVFTERNDHVHIHFIPALRVIIDWLV